MNMTRPLPVGVACAVVLGGLFASCKSAPEAVKPEPAAPHAPAPAPKLPPFDPTAQACASHIAPTPGPGYPTYKYNCDMPALPDGYPMARPLEQQPWRQGAAAAGPLDVKAPANIEKLMAALMAYVAPVFNPYIADPTNDAKRPDKAGWRMMPWLGDVDCDVGWDSGRDSSVGTSTGQLIPAGTLPGQRTDEGGTLQNHSITWYDPWGAYALAAVFGAPTPGVGDPTRQQMSDGSVIVKLGVLTPYADGTDWPIVESAPMWPVYRPPVGVSTNYCQNKDPSTFKVLETHLIQFDIILKSSYFAPKSEWVFATWLFDPSAEGAEPLDRFTLLGAMWGNDPGIAQKDLCTPVSPLQENWINPKTPEYGYQQLGWGCRLSGPIDVARRSAVFSDGTSCDTARVSSCLSCHGSAEYSLSPSLQAATLYPLQKGYSPFLVADPGSAQWNNWFQSRSGRDPQGDQQGDHRGDYIAFDYDMVFVTSVPISRAAAGDPALEASAEHYMAHLTRSRVQALRAPALKAAAVPASSPSAGCDCSCAPKTKAANKTAKPKPGAAKAAK